MTVTTSETSSRPHVAARIEDTVRRYVQVPLRRRGWRPRVVGHTGYGAPGWARVFGRVLLSPPKPAGLAGLAAMSAPPGLSSAASDRGPATEDPRRGWRAFLTVPVPDCPVVLEIGGTRHDVVTDRGGYVDVAVPVDLPSGWHDATLTAPGALPATARVRIVDETEDFGIVSDIDDTVMVTWLPRPLIAAWNTFVLSETARNPVPGMADLLRTAQGPHPGALVLYLSTGAWNVAPTLTRFLARHGFPAGPLLLTDWGPTNTGWFRSGTAHKRSALERLTGELPHVRWLLVGDDGQHDPEVYGAFAAAHPDRVRAVAIRHLSPTEQVLSRGLAADPQQTGRASARSEATWVVGPDGTALAERLRERALL